MKVGNIALDQLVLEEFIKKYLKVWLLILDFAILSNLENTWDNLLSLV